jgi:predicted dehydrogenase
LPDWHPWEDISEYYVSKRETGGCRELVPFELTWLNHIFGTPTPLALVKSKQSQMPADIDDIYHCLVRYDHNVLANITVDVLSRPESTREMIIVGSKGKIVFSGHENSVRYINSEEKKWINFALEQGHSENNYINPEFPYIEEMRCFVNAFTQKDKTVFPNNLLNDSRILKTLENLEALSSR